ncbi:hypothetical protein M011DRAFT_249970 [Sporormia fimetaria CBS 119925]|uniref:Uncharacterized protein n=1 Tax=Sporormia fimetaria CBS 119925 TaxID=1340428 RepID=A0A6A6UZ73_9PLEO|nr:hypothetical protein M011DRAFT_249970 [Sporormia fimetaria CBS 119925]
MPHHPETGLTLCASLVSLPRTDGNAHDPLSSNLDDPEVQDECFPEETDILDPWEVPGYTTLDDYETGSMTAFMQVQADPQALRTACDRQLNAIALHVLVPNDLVNGIQHIKVEVLLNGVLAASTIVDEDDLPATADSILLAFSGTRTGRTTERPWILAAPIASGATTTEHGNDSHLVLQQRWKHICTALKTEAEQRVDDHGAQPPSAHYLRLLSSMHMPDAVKQMLNPGGLPFGTIDTIITTGHGRKLPHSLDQAARILDPYFQTTPYTPTPPPLPPPPQPNTKTSDFAVHPASEAEMTALSPHLQSRLDRSKLKYLRDFAPDTTSFPVPEEVLPTEDSTGGTEWHYDRPPPSKFLYLGILKLLKPGTPPPMGLFALPKVRARRGVHERASCTPENPRAQLTTQTPWATQAEQATQATNVKNENDEQTPRILRDLAAAALILTPPVSRETSFAGIGMPSSPTPATRGFGTSTQMETPQTLPAQAGGNEAARDGTQPHPMHNNCVIRYAEHGEVRQVGEARDAGFAEESVVLGVRMFFGM